MTALAIADADEATILRQEVEEKAAAFREAVLRYRATTHNHPGFLLERRAAALSPESLTECRVFAGREALVSAFAKGAVGAEVGSQRGNFSRFLLDEIAPEVLHLFDIEGSTLRPDVRDDPRVRFHLGDSAPNLAALTDTVFDWIYIDGDHRYEGVRRDAEAALERCKTGGVLFFNDYITWSHMEAMPYGIVPVVNDLANSGMQMLGIALSSHGYFDVALRVPGSGR